MWVEIKHDVFEVANLSTLTRLITLLTWNPSDSISRFNVYVDPDIMDHNEAFDLLPQSIKGILREEFNTYVLINASIKHVVSGRKKEQYLDPEEAIHYFEQPLIILLENGLNDSHFIKSLVNNFAKKNSSNQIMLQEHIKNRWIVFDNAGGCSNVKNVITSKLQSFESIAAKYQKNSHIYLRCIIILDSDSEYPGEPIKPSYRLLLDYFKTIQLSSYHILKKRMVENYMPDEVYQNITDKNLKPWIKAYLSLSSAQKDHLNISKGFSKEIDAHGRRTPLKQPISDLFAIDKSTFNTLDGGFAYPKIKTKFPELFVMSPHSNKATLLQRANSTEISEIITLIQNCI